MTPPFMPGDTASDATPRSRRRIDASRRRLLMGVGGMLGLSLAGLSLPLARGEPKPPRMRDYMRTRFGDSGVAILEDWLALIERLSSQPLATQLRDTNDFFNRRVRWLDDQEIWGEKDYWATPLETLGRGQGDCEDFSIAKYMTLKALGVPVERMRMIYVRARIGRSDITLAHMVLGYYRHPSLEPLVLDNLLPNIETASERPDLDPLFSFNSEGLWAGSTAPSGADPTQRLSRWRNVLLRMQQQGLL